MTELERIQHEIDEDLRRLGLKPAEAAVDTGEGAEAPADLIYTASAGTETVGRAAARPVTGQDSGPDSDQVSDQVTGQDNDPITDYVTDYAAGISGVFTAAPAAVIPAYAARGDAVPAIAPGTPPAPVEDSVPESFYRETIRQAPPLPRAAKPYSWRKRLVAICLICTLGTGTLGLGIGAAGKLTEFLWFGGINKAVAGNNPANEADYGIESVSYLFTGGADGQGSLSDMVALVEPSAVTVSSVFAQVEQEQTPEQMNPFYRQQPQEETPNTAGASGIIFSEDARNVYIATNYHVVGGAASVAVNIDGSDLIPAKPVDSDEAADLAVISVDKAELRRAGVTSIVVARFGDSDLMEVGDTVIAIGNALGEGNIATQGIISATEKEINVEDRQLTVLQTDAAINFGNSGGMLLNASGEVIGINSARLFGYSVEGMGYSISSNIAKPILEEMMNTKSRPSLGIYGNTLTAELAARAGIPAMGVLVDSTIPGTGAERAGILSDDIITGFNGEPVMNMDVLVDAIKQCAVGDTVEVKVFRSGDLLTVYVTLGEADTF